MASGRLFCCLSLGDSRWAFHQRQLEWLMAGSSAAFARGFRMGFSTKATKMAYGRLFSCLSLMGTRWGFRQRQPKWLTTGLSAAFGSWSQDGVFVKGNQNGFRRALLLPFVLGHKMEAPPEATKTPSDMLFCCLCRRPNETYQGQRQQPRLRRQDFAASAEDPMKLSKVKGSNHASEAGFCCLSPLEARVKTTS